MKTNFEREHFENWAESQTQMNYFEHPTRLIYLDWDWKMRDRLANTYIRPELSKWSGIPEEDLEMTAFYGIREYVGGSWLRGHVDRIDTHVLSATMTLKTEGMQGEWPLEVTMPDGTRTEVETEPGSLVLYESAKIVHGRPRIYNGTYYYACFVHFRPKKWQGGTWVEYAEQANREIHTNQKYCRPYQGPDSPQRRRTSPGGPKPREVRQDAQGGKEAGDKSSGA